MNANDRKMRHFLLVIIIALATAIAVEVDAQELGRKPVLDVAHIYLLGGDGLDGWLEAWKDPGLVTEILLKDDERADRGETIMYLQARTFGGALFTGQPRELGKARTVYLTAGNNLLGGRGTFVSIAKLAKGKAEVAVVKLPRTRSWTITAPTQALPKPDNRSVLVVLSGTTKFGRYSEDAVMSANNGFLTGEVYLLDLIERCTVTFYEFGGGPLRGDKIKEIGRRVTQKDLGRGEFKVEGVRFKLKPAD